MYKRTLACLLLCLLARGAAAAALVPIDVPPLEGVEIVQRFGTDPARPYMPPAGVIDHPRAPSYAVDAARPDTAPLPAYRIGPDTWFLFGNIAEVDPVNRGFNGNAGFIVTDEGVVVIDALGTPYLGRRLIATVRAVTDRPIRYLVITHAHPDHYYGAAAFAELPGVRIISHAGTEKYVHSSTIQHSVAYRKVFLPREMEGFKAVVPDLLLGGGHPARLTLKLGGKTIDIYDVGHPHSHGDLVVHQVEDKILWVSDLAFNGRVTFLGDGNLREILPMQTWVRRQFPDLALMVPGHGAPQTPPFAMLDFTSNYVQALLERMRALYAAGHGLQEAVARADLPDYAHAPLYELNHRINANHVYRLVEEEAF
ncbi:MAG: MBL fold metallo-hydrolase [Thiobacillaceae bacterium]|nr:MBL fold metallo-hydrolase [Thiobacillaceae bacterium]MCX7672316.1 MBL fold metallo-hydrolase [Thiobacillaceae bacterium]MDW8323255.1 MBL fold metallo-hydrolase [Burkholderiales bacterium]